MDDKKSTSNSVESLQAEETDAIKIDSAEIQDDTCFGKCKGILRLCYNARALISLSVILVVYALLGALMFVLIESKHEQKYKSNITSIRENMIEVLLLKPPSVNDEKIWKLETNALLIEYETSIRHAINNNVPGDSTQEVWTMWSSLFFVFTVFTTIGYGNLTPVTKLGRIMCIVYSAVGVPLALLLLAELGKRFTMALKFLWSFVRMCYYRCCCKKIRDRNPFQNKHENNTDLQQQTDEHEHNGRNVEYRDESVHVYEVDDAFNVPITVAVLILLVYILLGALMYTIWEDWDFVEAIYFVSISLSTIGFGDILPAHQKFFVFSSIYMFIGLSLVSMCITVAIEFFSAAAVRAKRKVEEAKKKIGDTAMQAHRSAKEKVADIRTNITDETMRLKQKTDEKVKQLKINFADETSKLLQKTDEKISGIKLNISEETTKLCKKADGTFTKNVKESSPSIAQLVQQTRDTYVQVGSLKTQNEADKV